MDGSCGAGSVDGGAVTAGGTVCAGGPGAVTAAAAPPRGASLAAGSPGLQLQQPLPTPHPHTAVARLFASPDWCKLLTALLVSLHDVSVIGIGYSNNTKSPGFFPRL